MMKEALSFHIKIDNLSIGYMQPGKKPFILRDGLNFSANSGEMVALIGSNGIGKSTLLRSVVGFQDYFSGDVLVDGRPIKSFSTHERAKIISFVSTGVVSISNMNVFDLVAYGRFPHTNRFGRISEDDKNIILKAIKDVGLQGFESKLITQISDGERQRAMIARALAQDTPVIILDEPTAFLDISNKYEIFHLLQVVASQQQKTVVLSTHDLNIALREVDKLWVLMQDQTYEGAPEDAALSGKMEELFKNPHIGFDTEEGEYFFKKQFREKVKVIGGGIPLTWTLRALNRQGFQIVTDASPDFTITIREEKQCNWVLSQKDKPSQTFGSIYEMFSHLV